MSCRLAIVTVVLMLVTSGAVPVGAQDATATAGASGPQWGSAPNPTDCVAPPVSVDELIDLWYGPDASPDGTPIVAQPAPGVIPKRVPIPLGEPVDSASAAAVAAAVWTLFACFNAGDQAGAYGLYSDNLRLQFGPPRGTTAAAARAFLTAPLQPLLEEVWTPILAVTDISRLVDGRVAAFVVVGNAVTNAAFTQLVILIEGPGGWIIDSVVEFTRMGG